GFARAYSRKRRTRRKRARGRTTGRSRSSPSATTQSKTHGGDVHRGSRYALNDKSVNESGFRKHGKEHDASKPSGNCPNAGAAERPRRVTMLKFRPGAVSSVGRAPDF